LKYCAHISSKEHGDARRAIDFLRTSGEIASLENKKISILHVVKAIKQLQKNQITTIISGASYHFQLACAALIRITYLSNEGWHSTSELYRQYQIVLPKKSRPISYRRFSEMLVELVNSGITVSQTLSKGRHGYGSQFKVTADPMLIGTSCFSDWWVSVVEAKVSHDTSKKYSNIQSSGKRSYAMSNFSKLLESKNKEQWDKYVGL